MPTIDELRRNLEALADEPGARTDAELLAAAREQTGTPGLTTADPGRRQTARVVVAAAAVVALVAGAAWWLRAGHTDERIITGEDPADSPERRGSPVWQDLPLLPQGLAAEAVLVPGGVFAWQGPGGGPSGEPATVYPAGGSAAFSADGSQAWTKIDSDTAGPLPEADSSDTIWTGDEVVRVSASSGGGVGPLEVQRWRPGDDAIERGTPTEIPGAPEDAWLGVRLTTDGGDVLALVSVPQAFGGGSSYLVDNHLLRYRPDDDEWITEEDPPQTGDRIYGFEQTPAGLLITSAVPPPQGAQLNQYGTVVVDRQVRPGVWDRSTPAPAEITGQSAGAVWAEDRLMVVSYRPSAATWDPERDAWTLTDVPPIDGCEDYPTALRTADRVITGYCARFAARSDGDEAWEFLPTSPEGATLRDADDGRVLAYLNQQDRPPRLAILAWE
jgi:hypothetical protein